MMKSLRYLLLMLPICLQTCLTLAQEDAEDPTSSSSRGQGPPYTTCDDECQHQVKILEGFIALTMIICGLGVGICCLKCINTPTAFASSGVTSSKKKD